MEPLCVTVFFRGKDLESANHSRTRRFKTEPGSSPQLTDPEKRKVIMNKRITSERATRQPVSHIAAVHFNVSSRLWSPLLMLTVALTASLSAFGVPAAGADDAAKKKAAKVTYDDHIRPIFREHCFSCHNQNSAKSGLALDSYAAVIEGGSSGEVVFEDDLDSSRLWALVTHDEDPIMPPGQDKLPDAKLALIRKWIEMSMPENSGSQAKAKKKTLNLAIQPSAGKPEGPAAMPTGLSTEPVIYTPRSAAISAVATSPWAPLVAVAGQQQVLLYHADTGQLLGVLPFPEGIAYSLRFSRDGSKLLAGGGRGGYAGCAVLYDVRSGARLVKVGDELDAVLAADINADLTRVALGGPGRIVRIFSTETGEKLHEIRKHTDWIYAVRFSSDGVLLATADRSNGLFVWEADTAREYLDLRGHTGPITDIAWRDDSNVLASASMDGSVRLWEMNDGKQIAKANAHGGGVNSVAFAHDGRVATAGQDKTAKLWNPGLKPLKTFPAFGEPALEVAVTHDGKRVVAGDWAGQVRMWTATDAKQTAMLPANPPTLDMQIAAQQKQLVAARELAAKAAVELATVEQRVAEANNKNAAKVKAAEAKAQQLAQAVAQAKTQQQTTTSQVAQGSTEMGTAQKAVEQAKKALEDATAKLNAAKQTLAVAQQREQKGRQHLPKAEKQLQAGQAALAKAKTDAAKQIAVATKELNAKKTAAQAAQKAVEQLQAEVKKLQANKAPE